jgi:hypothetical protein
MSTQPHSLTQTRKQILPYDFRLLADGRICIFKTNGQRLIVSRGQVEHILQSSELDAHRRKMYEAALEVWKEQEKKQ